MRLSAELDLERDLRLDERGDGEAGASLLFFSGVLLREREPLRLRLTDLVFCGDRDLDGEDLAFFGEREDREFLGDRDLVFLGDREDRAFFGDREALEFLGDREAFVFLGDREALEFLGEREDLVFLGEREALVFRGDLEDLAFRGEREDR